jgi:hypothetical protein
LCPYLVLPRADAVSYVSSEEVCYDEVFFQLHKDDISSKHLFSETFDKI